MMKKRKLLSVLLIASLLCIMMPPASAIAADMNTEAVDNLVSAKSNRTLTIKGGVLGQDYTYDNETIVIKTSTPIVIDGQGVNIEGKIVVSENIEANITLQSIRLLSNEGPALEISKNAKVNVTLGKNEYYDDPNMYFNSLSVDSLSQDEGAIFVAEGACLNLKTLNKWDTHIEGCIKNNGEITFEGSGVIEVGSYTDADSSPYEYSIDGGKVVVNSGTIRFYCIKVDEFEINSGEVDIRLNAWEAIKATNCIINDGLVNWFWDTIDSWDSDDRSGPRLIAADNLQIKGGIFVNGGNISRSSVYGCEVAEGKMVTINECKDDDYSNDILFSVVDEDSVPGFEVSGNGADYSNHVLALNDGANVTISSKGQTNDYIKVGTYQNPVHATLTLAGVDIRTAKPTINVDGGSSLTIILKHGTYNSLESVSYGKSAIHSETEAEALTICGDGTLDVQGSESGISGGQINIESGTINAKSGPYAGAAIGSESYRYSKVNISGGNITAEGGTGIGGGVAGSADVTISGGNINAISPSGAAIGNGNFGYGEYGQHGSILIEGGTIHAISESSGAAIGSGRDGSISEIRIKDGDIIAENRGHGAAIGTGWAVGYYESPSQDRNATVDNIIISGGSILAKGGEGAAAIGGGQSLDGYISQVGTIEISGGTIEAYGGAGADGIGAGSEGIGGKFSTGKGNPVIITNSISDQNSESVWNGVFIVDNMNGGVGKIYGNKVTPTNDFTIPAGKTLEVDADQSLVIAKGITATNNGTVIRDKNGVVDVQGTWLGNPVTVKDEEEGSAVTGVTLNKRTLALKPGENEILMATVSPVTAANKSLRWTSSNTDVATVDANGRVTAMANGMAVITVSTVDGGFTAQCTVTISEKQTEVVAVENVKLNKTSLTLDIGESESLTATVTPEDAANKNMTWSSNDEDVASVDAKGKVTAISRGTATITVRTEDGNFAAQCKVTVTDPNATTTDTETQPDGSTVTTVEDVNGSSSSTTIDVNGVVNTSVTLSDAAVSDAAKNDTAVILPMVGVKASKDIASAPSVTVDLPGNDPVQVEIPVLDMTPGTVAVLVDKNGSETILKNSVLGNNGLIVTLSDGETVKILDNTQSFSDVASNHWAKNNIDYVTSRGLFVGTSASEFAPETPMTRAMIVSVLQRYEGDDTVAAPGEDWYEGARQWAIKADISDGSNMLSNVTREQLVTMLYRYIGSPQVVGGLNSYSDVSSVSGYAEQAMIWAVRNGIIGGMTDDTLVPQGMATRAQVAAILQRFIAWEQTA